jgi:hypothetical protein
LKSVPSPSGKRRRLSTNIIALALAHGAESFEDSPLAFESEHRAIELPAKVCASIRQPFRRTNPGLWKNALGKCCT